MTAWPAAAWESEWLAGIDGASRPQIEAAGAVRALARGDAVFREGQNADRFFVVAEGVVEVRGTRRGEAVAATLRKAIAGDAVGEEAIVRPGAARVTDARCATDAVVVEVPVAVFRRAVSRSGAARAGELEGRLRRSAVRDALRASSLGVGLGEDGVRELAAASEDRALDRGDVIAAQGDPVERVVVVADGLVQAMRTEEGRASVRAYLGRGDVLDQEPGPGGHDAEVTACGPAWVILLDPALVRRWSKRGTGAMTRLRQLRLVTETETDTSAATRHVTQDLWRFAVAGSMLVIDDEVCVRCGHCASSCSDAHGDGVSRLVRRGEKVAVHDALDGSARALVLPGSCQHCRNPVCMRDCPTGAIGREADGRVFVREDLCVGCGACAKACPWGSITMAPRREGSAPAGASPLVAVKCDACRGIDGGPACVAGCPVDAIVRIDPVAALADVHERLGRGPRPRSGRAGDAPADTPAKGVPRKRSAAAWLAAGAMVGLSFLRLHATTWSAHRWTGLLSGGLFVVLCSYSVAKRTRGLRLPSRAGRSAVRWHAVGHAALGLVAVGVVAAHAGWGAPPNAAGALLVAFWGAALSGVAVAIGYRVLPPALARVEREARLPEDLPQRARELDERAFGLLSGRSAAEKTVYARILAPYARAPFGPMTLAVRRGSLRDEERRLAAHVEGIVGPDRAAQMSGLAELVRWAVERRAIGAQALLQRGLRAVLPVHVAAVAAAVVLLVVHVWLVARSP